MAERLHSARAQGAHKTLALAAALVVASLVALQHVDTAPFSPSSRLLPWWVLVLGFAFAEFLEFHLEIGHETHTFTFSEAPFVIGLLYADPRVVIVARMLGEVGYLVAVLRSRPTKVLLNTAMYLAECTAALLVFDTLRGPSNVSDPRTFFAVIAAIIVADTIGFATVSLAIHWHGGAARRRLVLVAGLFTGITNASLALVGAVLMESHPWSLVLLLVLVVNQWLAYRSYAALARRFERLQLFQSFTRAVTTSASAAVVVERVLQQARQLCRCDYARIEMLGGGGTDTIAFELRGSAAMQECGPLQTRVLDGGAVRVVRAASKSLPDQTLLAELDTDDCVVALLHSDGVVVGALVVGDRIGDASTFDDGDGRLLDILANHASVALENGRLIDQLHSSVDEIAFQALHDSLTGLANRSGFTEAVSAALALREPNEAVAVLLMDLDRFKEINDTLGHYAGDQLLIEIGQRLAQYTIDGAVVARLGGDEFAMMIPRVGSVDEAVGAAHALRERLVEVATLGSFTVDVGVSIGVAIAPLDGEDLVTLLQRADVAMYDAKRSRSGVELYEPERDDHSVYRLSLANSLRSAITNGELAVHFQPKADIESGRIIGVEALVRWNHTEHGLISPDDFIPVAEQSGLITELTDFVLDTSLAQSEKWRRLGLDLTVAVNVSPYNLIDSSFARRLEHRLVEHRVEPSRLVLEITESGMLELDQVLALLDRISGMGVTLSVDDFGTGYSSLSYLHALPVGEVKIDRSFIVPMAAKVGDLGVVRAIVDLGHNLGLRVVAEGVEDRFTWDELAALGCDLVQGYFVSRPQPPDVLTDWLLSWDRSALATPRGVRTTTRRARPTRIDSRIN